jgi:quercetin dioxygenase-like cupin family protein
MTSMRQLILAPDEGLSVENPVGGILTFKITSEESGGRLTALETIAAPGEGPPLHVHEQDELIYALEGSFRVKLGDPSAPCRRDRSSSYRAAPLIPGRTSVPTRRASSRQ